jgi:hypothetical protein
MGVIDPLPTGPSLPPEQTTAVALIGVDNRTHTAKEEAVCTLSGLFLRLTKNGQASTNSDLVFAEFAH